MRIRGDHVHTGMSKQLVLTEEILTTFRIYILLQNLKLYRISAVKDFAKHVCKNEHGMFQSILNLLCLKKYM